MTQTETAALCAGFPVRVENAVRWGDMDAFGHVNNTIYFRYFECARIAYFERIGFVARLEDLRIGPIVAATDCRFRLPLTYPDRVVTAARVHDVGEDRFTMAYRVISERHGRLAAEGSARVVAFDYAARRKAALPAEVRAAIAEIETD